MLQRSEPGRRGKPKQKMTEWEGWWGLLEMCDPVERSGRPSILTPFLDSCSPRGHPKTFCTNFSTALSPPSSTSPLPSFVLSFALLKWFVPSRSRERNVVHPLIHLGSAVENHGPDTKTHRAETLTCHPLPDGTIGHYSR